MTTNFWFLAFLLPFAVTFLLLNTLFYLIPSFVHPENFASTCELARMYDYHCEEHSVTTEDDFILTIHRINGKASTL